MKRRWAFGVGRWAFIAMLLAVCAGAQQAPKSKIVVASDGFPTGNASPEGPACDLARAFIKHDPALLKRACVKPFERGESRAAYEDYLKGVPQQMKAEAKKPTPSPAAPKRIAKVFAARHLSNPNPGKNARSFGFKDVQFVDVGLILHSGKKLLARTLVLQTADGKWYAFPVPAATPALSQGLNEETASTKDFKEAHEAAAGAKR